MLEICFEHLDSYFRMNKMDSVNQSNMGENDKQQILYENSSGENFSDSEADLSDDVTIDTYGKRSQSILGEGELLSVEIKRKIADIDGDSDCCNSEDTESLHSDSETESFNFPQHNPKTDGDNPVLGLEYVFDTKMDFKNAVATHEIKNGKSIQWCRNDNLRVEAICIHHPECKWKIKASKMQRDKAFQVRTYDPIHTCKKWHYENKTITSSFIVRKYLKEVASNRN